MKQGKGNSIHNQKSFDFQFSLRKIQAVPLGRFIEVDFSPIVSKSTKNLLKVFPTFNFDKKAYMPSFIQPAQIENYEQHENLYKSLHDKKLIQANQEKEELFLPKPSKKNSCCCICKTLYDDYLTHISNPQHQLLMQKSPFNDDIYQMCLSFSFIKREISQQTLDQDNFSEKPKKKRKVQTQTKKTKRNQDSRVSTTIDSLEFLSNKIVHQTIA